MLPVYKSYCSNQVSASVYLQNRIESDQNFGQLLKRISSESGSYLPLSSYLIKPMQRLTKYPLLIEKILKHTPSDHADYGDCDVALQLAKKFCTEINDACRKYEDFSRLDWIQKNVAIELKQIRQEIDFNSETKFLGS